MNKIEVEISIDKDGRASAEIKNLNREVEGFGAGVNRAGSSGTSLKTIFAGNVLADFFTRSPKNNLDARGSSESQVEKLIYLGTKG